MFPFQFFWSKHFFGHLWVQSIRRKDGGINPEEECREDFQSDSLSGVVGFTEEGRKAEEPKTGRGQKDAQRLGKVKDQGEEEVKRDVVVQKATEKILF